MLDFNRNPVSDNLKIIHQMQFGGIMAIQWQFGNTALRHYGGVFHYGNTAIRHYGGVFHYGNTAASTGVV